ncbi:hypothetical protein Q1695_006257 [Nippostrongylus brasiliensis]|nr:hypothetical protein Q1695_006257 [Nippostrongylus brasiliensis]
MYYAAMSRHHPNVILLLLVLYCITVNGQVLTENYMVRKETDVKLRCGNSYIPSQYSTQWIFKGQSGTEKVMENRALLERRERVTESGTYTCMVDQGYGSKKEVARITVTVLTEYPDYPKLNLTAIGERPRGISIRWKTKWKYDIETRRVEIFVNKKGETRSNMSFFETKDEEGNITYPVGPEGGIFVVTVVVRHIDGLGYEQYNEAPYLPPIDELMASNIQHTIDKSSISLTWDVKGAKEGEVPSFQVKVESMEDGKKILQEIQNTTQKTAIVRIRKRPQRLLITVYAIVGEFTSEGNPLDVELPELVLKDSPENLTAEVLSSKEVYVKFVPVPVEAIIGEDKGCKVYVCKQQTVDDTCFTKQSTPQSTEVKFEELKPGELYYTAAQCFTNAGGGPMTPWIGLETAPDTLEPGQTRAPSRTSAFDVSITAEYELKVTVRWNISMTNGSEFKNEYVKSLQVARFKRVDGKNTDRVVITNDIYLRQMETGISPGYLLDRSCYFHMINVTFQNNLNIIETTELKCFDFSSPSWLIVYLVAFVGILVLACIMFHLTSPKVKRQRQMSLSKSKSSTASTRTARTATFNELLYELNYKADMLIMQLLDSKFQLLKFRTFLRKRSDQQGLQWYHLHTFESSR